jgi:FimV-like protein
VAADEDILAIESAQRAIELDPNRLESYELLGEGLFARGLYPDAAAVYEALLVRPGLDEQSTPVKTANARLARLYFWGGAFDRAAPYLERALASGTLDAATLAALADDLLKDPGCRGDLRLQLAEACVKAGDPDHARPGLERVLGCGDAGQKERARIALDGIAAGSGAKSP